MRLTVFPSPWTLGASWNATLVGEVAATIAAHARAAGADIVFGPVLNLFADARFGRHEEGFSPDPILTSHYAHAAASGYQGETEVSTVLLTFARFLLGFCRIC